MWSLVAITIALTVSLLDTPRVLRQTTVLTKPLDDIVAVVTDDGPSQFTLTLENAGTGSVRRVSLPREADLIVDITRWSNRLFVRGAADGVSVLFVVDVDSAIVIDKLYADFLSVSPDGRFAAFKKARPRNDDGSDVYVVYDIAKTAADNRMQPRTGLGAMVSCGVAVYPPSNVRDQTYDWTPDQPTHKVVSPISWIDATTFAFVDYSEQTATVVLVSMRSGISNPDIRTKRLDTDQVIDVAKLHVDAAHPPASRIIVSDILPIKTTATGWVIELAFVGGGDYFKTWTLDLEI